MHGSRLFCIAAALAAWSAPLALTPASQPVGTFFPLTTRIAARVHPNGCSSSGSGAFEVNSGQFDNRVDFVARGRDSAVYLTSGDAVLQIRSKASSAAKGQTNVLKMKLRGRNRHAPAEPLNPLPGRTNYFRGSDPRKWHYRIPTYSHVRYRDLYPGIDGIYYFDQAGRLEYDFVVGPGADPGTVRLRFEGARRVTIDSAGDLVLDTPGAPVIVHKPKIYQRGNGHEVPVQGGFVLAGNQEVRFTVARYDKRNPLWIDPTFEFSTYLGGRSNDEGNAVATDADGNVYITGFTYSFDFPVVMATQPSLSGDWTDAFVTKIDASGVVQYSTYLGGQSIDKGSGIAADLAGNVYITGSTLSSIYAAGFPTTSGAFQRTGNYRDAFVAKLDPQGALLAATLLGGSDWDEGAAIGVDGTGRPYVCGTTRSSDFPILAPLQAANGGDYDAFLTRLNPDLTGLDYSTFLGGAREDWGRAVAVDFAGNASVAGFTDSTNFPTVNAIQPNLRGASDAFVAKLDSSGARFLFSTFFGGSLPSFTGGSDEATAVAVDGSGNTIVGGFTNSTDLPTVQAFQPNIAGPSNPVNGSFENDGFIARFGPGGELLHSTYLGGNADDWINAVAVDDAGDVFSAGLTRSTNFPSAGPEPSPIGDTGAYKSSDGGVQWTRITTGLTSPTLTALAVDPVSPEVVYAGTENDGVFKSVDGGANWQRSSAGLTSLFVTALVIDPFTPSTLYVGTTGRGVHKSYDGGATWNPANTFLYIPNIVSLTIDPTNPSILYAGTLMRGFGAQILFKSVNGAASWTPVFGREINAAAVDPSAPTTVYAASHVLLFKSVDGGSTWTQIFREPFSLYYISVVLIDASQPSTVYVGTLGNGVFKSLDSGATWQAAKMGLPNGVTSLVLDPNQPSTLYAGTDGTGVFKSIDGGASWLASNTGLSGVSVSQLAIDPQTPSRLYAAADGLKGDAFISVLGSDGSLVFSSYAGGGGRDVARGIAVSPSQRVHIGGLTGSSDWPTSPDAPQPNFARGGTDAFLATLPCPLPVSISEPSANPTLLWPPDHGLVPVAVQYTAHGCGSVNCSLVVTSNEPPNGTGDGDTAPDLQIVDAQKVLLRAERSALGTGRVYEITITCSDSAGHRAERTVRVRVPIGVN